MRPVSFVRHVRHALQDVYTHNYAEYTNLFASVTECLHVDIMYHQHPSYREPLRSPYGSS